MNIAGLVDLKVALGGLVVALSKVRARKDLVMKDGVEHHSTVMCKKMVSWQSCFLDY